MNKDKKYHKGFINLESWIMGCRHEMLADKPTYPVILFCQGMFTAQLMMAEPKTWRYNLIWQKDRPTGFLNAKRMPMRSHEDIAVFYRALPTFNPQMRQGSPSHSRGNKQGKQKGNACYGSYNIETYSNDY